MSERKVLNKYYPPDFDPSKIPRVRQSKNRQFTVRLMAPCNMRCDTCGEYIYKGKKFNARKEDVENDTYLGIRIYRFYIKCTRCLQEISFKTDPQSTDYIIEAGASRNFMALKLAEEQAEKEEAAEQEELATNPMKLLERRTEASRNEMASLEALEELKELNQRKVNLDYDTMLTKYDDLREEEIKREEDEDEKFIQDVFGKNGNGPIIRRIEEDSDDSDDGGPPTKIFAPSNQKPTDILTGETKKSEPKEEKSVGMLSVNKKKLVLVKPKTATNAQKIEAPPVVTSGTSTSQIPASATSTPSTSTGPNASGAKPQPPPNGIGGLSLLGAYGSDSDDSNNSENE